MTQELHFRFDAVKAINAILYVAHKIERRDFHKIFKILYFADRSHLVEYGRPITGDRYHAMEFGPVPSNVYDIFKAVAGTGYFKDSGEFSKFISVEGHIISPKAGPDLSFLSGSDLAHLDESINRCKNMGFTELSRVSHDEAWDEARKQDQQDGPMKFDTMVKAAGGDDAYLNYLREFNTISTALGK